MLKRLDELVETYGDRKMFVGVPLVGVAAAWAALRDELAAERCDACRWWRGTSEPGHVVQRCAYIDTLMYPDACCSHFLALREDFEKKEPA
jgi:hypothetical protein